MIHSIIISGPIQGFLCCVHPKNLVNCRCEGEKFLPEELLLPRINLKKICSLFLGLLVINFTVLSAAEKAPKEKASALFIDSRLVLMAHPIFSSFDPSTRRFLDTESDPSLIRTIGQEGVKKKVDALEAQIKKQTESWKKKISQAKFKDVKKLETQFFAEKRGLDKDLEILRGQLKTVKVFPERPAFSELRTIIPSIEKISLAVRHTLVKLKDLYQADLVFDVAPLLPKKQIDVNTSILSGYSIKSIWKKKSGELPENFLQWVGEARNYWANQDVFAVPVVCGAKDCRLEAVKIIKQAETGKR